MFAKCHPDILQYLRMSHCLLRSLSPSLPLNLWRDFFAIHWNVHVMYWSRPICRCSQSPWEVSKKLILSVAWLSPSFPPLLIRGANWNPVKKRRGHIGLWGLVGVAGLGPKDPPPSLPPFRLRYSWCKNIPDIILCIHYIKYMILLGLKAPPPTLTQVRLRYPWFRRLMACTHVDSSYFYDEDCWKVFSQRQDGACCKDSFAPGWTKIKTISIRRSCT